jgi:small-conductance mechanosensitive channel
VLPFGIAVVDSATDILITVLVCYVAWEWINAAIQKRLKLEMPDDDEEMEEGGAGGSRIGTLLLLLRKFMFAVIVVMVTMIILSRLGINIGPLIAGASMIGLAFSFGAQTLVKDIIAGLFFLIDDAFRVGDYISVGSTKGMVEQISLRSFKLRHPRGMVNTIPFGSIGTVTNFSRDYIITKLDFRVRYDADVEKIRKIIKKKVYKVILKNEEMASKLLGKIKSQGVRQMDDSAMVMRVKFKTIPGEQFVIRKEVFRLMQEAFREAGIEFAHRNVTVYMPPGSPPSTEDATGNPDEQTKRQAAAAAAQALLEEEAAAKKAAAAKSKK